MKSSGCMHAPRAEKDSESLTSPPPSRPASISTASAQAGLRACLQARPCILIRRGALEADKFVRMMAPKMSYLPVAFVLALLFLAAGPAVADYGKEEDAAFVNDAKLLQVALNLEFLEAEFFLFAVKGYGLDKLAPELPEGGPPPKGAQKANLDAYTADIIWQFGLQEVGHLRAIKDTLGKYYFSRPQLDLSKSVFAEIIDKAFGEKLDPPFDPYVDSIHYWIATYIIPYVGLTGYVGANPDLLTPLFKRRVAGLLAVESGQDAVTRGYLYERKDEKVEPYDYTVTEFTNKISSLRNYLSHALVDEGLYVPKELGAEQLTNGNVLAGDKYSLGYARTPEQIFSTVYGTGNPSKPGGFYPNGAKGIIAEAYLNEADVDE